MSKARVRPTYERAVELLEQFEDTDRPVPGYTFGVSVVLVAELFGKAPDVVAADLVRFKQRRGVKAAERASEAR